jgi:hypothetical protein
VPRTSAGNTLAAGPKAEIVTVYAGTWGQDCRQPKGLYANLPPKASLMSRRSSPFGMVNLNSGDVEEAAEIAIQG